MRAGQVSHRAARHRRAVERDPRGDRVGLGDRPVRLVLVRVGLAAARSLVQRLVVPEPQRVDAEQLARGLPDALMERERTERGVVLPEVDALLERLLVRRAFFERPVDRARNGCATAAVTSGSK